MLKDQKISAKPIWKFCETSALQTAMKIYWPSSALKGVHGSKA
jgi:hypothetical protein